MAHSKPKAGPTLDDVIASLPQDSQTRIQARTETLRREVEGLKALRRLTAQSQSQIAERLGIKQPSIVKMERQTDLYLSTLRRFVEAAGGTLHLSVDLPDVGHFELTGLGDLQDQPSAR